jgi:hypothetical protein
MRKTNAIEFLLVIAIAFAFIYIIVFELGCAFGPQEETRVWEIRQEYARGHAGGHDSPRPDPSPINIDKELKEMGL